MDEVLQPDDTIGISRKVVPMNRRKWLCQAGTAAGLVAWGAWRPALGQPKTAAKSADARLGGQIDAAEFMRFDGSPEDAGFDALLAALRKQNRPTSVRFPSATRMWSLTGERAFDLPSQIRWDFGTVRLVFNGQLRGNSSLLTFGPGSEVLGLQIELQAQSRFDRLLSVSDDSLVDRLLVQSARQQSTSADDNTDGMLQLRGSRIRVRASAIRGVDKPLMVFGAGATTADSHHLTDVQIDDLRITSYVTGIHIRNVRGCVIKGFVAETRSPNASQQPGHNGILAGHVEDFRLEQFRIDDAGEHAVRFGGSPNPAELNNRTMHVVKGEIRRAGKCGVKVWGGGKTADRNDGISSEIRIRSVVGTDLGFGGKLGVNEDLVHLEAVRKFELLDLSVTTDRAAQSCHDAVFIAGGSDGRIEGLNVRSAARSAVWITDTVAKDEAYPVRSISGQQIRSSGHRGDMIHFDIRREESGPFSFTGLESSDGGAVVGGEISGGSQPVVAQFSGRAERQRGPASTLTGRAQVQVQIRSSR